MTARVIPAPRDRDAERDDLARADDLLDQDTEWDSDENDSDFGGVVVSAREWEVPRQDFIVRDPAIVAWMRGMPNAAVVQQIIANHNAAVLAMCELRSICERYATECEGRA